MMIHGGGDKEWPKPKSFSETMAILKTNGALLCDNVVDGDLYPVKRLYRRAVRMRGDGVAFTEWWSPFTTEEDRNFPNLQLNQDEVLSWEEAEKRLKYTWHLYYHDIYAR